jgi:hypothetical protein
VYPTQEVYSISPSSSTINVETTDWQYCVRLPRVNSGGTNYMEYAARNTVNRTVLGDSDMITSDTLYLFQINPDNTSNSAMRF